MALMRERAGPGRQASATGARAFVTLDELLRLKHRAHGFSFQPRQPVHSLLAGRHASRLRGRGLNFEELRHYFEGDDTRTIDWLATARLGSPHVRVYSEERDRPVLLLVDQRSTMFFGSRRMMKSVAAAEAAALAAWRVTSLGDRVGAVVFGDDGIVTVSPQARDHGQIEVDTSSAVLRDRFREEREQWRARLASLSRNRAIPVLPLSTERDVATQLRELIGRRQEQRLGCLGGRAS